MTHKTEIRIEISAANADLVAELRDDLNKRLDARTSQLIGKHKGSLVLFTTRSCAVMPEGTSYPWDEKPATPVPAGLVLCEKCGWNHAANDACVPGTPATNP